MRRDIAHLIQVLWAHLTDVKINHVTVICVNLSQLILSEVLSVKPVLNVHVLVREDH